MSGVYNVDIKENDGNVFVGDQLQQNNIVINNYTIICNQCGAGGYNHTQAAQGTSSCNNATEGAIQPVLPRLQLNDNELNIPSDSTDSNVCLFATVYEQDDKIVVERPLALSQIVTGHHRENNYTHFEVQLRVKSCKLCEGNNGEITTCSLTTQEFECISSIHDLDENRPLELRRVNYKPESETPFQAFLTKSQNLIRAEGNSIRIITTICENGKKVRIKLRFDVRRSVKRRSKSLPDLSPPRKCPEKSNSFRNIGRSSSYSQSSASLCATHSAITILDGEVNVGVSETPESVLTTIAPERIFHEIQQNTEDKADGSDELNYLNGLESQDVFATGKFGPLYKVSSKEGREQLVKIVKMDTTENEIFLEEARQFCKCRNPYIRPTADILEHNGRSYVFYWYLDGHSLFKAIEDNTINDYVIFCRILFGVVKGLVYLRRRGIQCQFLMPEKILLDTHFNPRISGVGLAYFQHTEHAETSHGDFHRSLSYLDCSLRSRKENHPKNVLWSVGRCIWDMLLGRICHKPGEEDPLSTKYHILEHLGESCDNQTIKSKYFNPELRKIVYGAGWPKDKEITKSLVVCAVRCMLVNLEERMSLDDLHSTLEVELCELQKREKFSLYEISDNLCLYCIKNERENLPLTCGCVTACNDCLRNNEPLDCPEHGMQYSTIGHPLTYGVIIQGEFKNNPSICENDSDAIECILNDQNIFAIKNFERIKSTSRKEATDELERIKTKIMGDKKAKYSEYPTTLLLYITGHCNDTGGLILPDGKILKKKILCDFIYGINPKNLIVLANGYYSQKLVKSLSEVKTNFFTSRKFYGVFSHAGNMCGISHKDISDENSILVRFILDIFKKDRTEGPSSSNGATKRYFTAAGLADEISKLLKKKCNKCLMPIDREGGRIPIAYI